MNVPYFTDEVVFLFIQVAELGSISGAAAAGNLPQSVVSRQISQLETDVGARLFRRTGRGVVLTEFGEEIRPRLVRLMHEAEQLADDMRSRSGIPMGEVRIGLLPSAVPMVVGPLLSEVKQRWPQIRLHFTEGSSSQLEEWLAQGRIDLALLLREGDAARTNEAALIQLPLYLVVPINHPFAARKSISFEQVAPLALVLPGEPHPLRSTLAMLARKKNLTLAPAIEAGSTRLQHEIVASGGGFAITAGLLSVEEARRLARVRIVRPVLLRSIVLGVTTHRPYTLATRSVESLIRTRTQALLKS